MATVHGRGQTSGVARQGLMLKRSTASGPTDDLCGLGTLQGLGHDYLLCGDQPKGARRNLRTYLHPLHGWHHSSTSYPYLTCRCSRGAE